MNAAECHYRLKQLMETQERLANELRFLNVEMNYGRTQDHVNLDLARTHMILALENLLKLNMDLEQVLHIALAQEVEDKHARASELKQ
jgi:hypothetical protein